MQFLLKEPSWRKWLEPELKRPELEKLRQFLSREKELGKIIFPPEEQIFDAFNLTPFEDVKVVILGQDPYHGPGQAHGLSFSVPEKVALPPSLQNIFKELKNDLGVAPLKSGNLIPWAKQGVLLLNTVLTVEATKAGSHHGQGWEEFTDKVIEVLNQHKSHLVFILWGSPAQKKARHLDPERHLLISSPHPSPLASYRGFFGSRPFSRCNQYLKQHGLRPIDWSL